MNINCGDLFVATAERSDIPELNAVFDEALEFFEDTPGVPLTPPEICIDIGDAPFGGQQANYELLTLRAGCVIVGSMGVYRDTPHEGTVRITSMYIAAAARGNGFGGKALDSVCRFFRQAGYSRFAVRIPASDLRALSFFFHHGFDRIVQCSIADGGAEDTAPTGSGFIEVTRSCRRFSAANCFDIMDVFV